jgi:predicted transcriptional regulator YdeE
VLSSFRIRSFTSPRRFIGLATTTPSSFSPDHDVTGVQVGELFQQLTNELTATGVDNFEELVGISRPADAVIPPQLLWYFAGYESQSLSVDSLDELVVPAGDYFAVTYQGAITGFDAAVNEIYGTIFPDSGLTPRDGLHLEVYPADWDRHDEHSRMDILIPIASGGILATQS